MANKTFAGYLVLNWKTGAIKVLKRRSKRTNPFEILIRFTIEVVLPETEEHEISGKIVIPEEQVAEMVFEKLKEE
ncbi:MAG: hypothetical protein H5T49_03245 [Hadesarchaea archaeon]|nr:hypothetical protein [Hadesarchaea archaeon]